MTAPEATDSPHTEELSFPSTFDKVLRLNLNPSIYGTFAEIGAGQDVTNWFFRVGASAGTIAKTISAYDMTMSDAIYGKCSRYVSRERLAGMLDHEYAILVERLGPGRGNDSTFFSFANTVRARGYKDTGECHGWLGIRFQLEPGAAPSDILLHVRMLDETNLEQQRALGILGVNLIYAAFYHRDSLAEFVACLKHKLEDNQIEVDMLKFSGHGYEEFDNRLCSLHLVRGGLTDAALWGPDGEVRQPAEQFYKKPLVLLRGRFNPVTKVNLDMLESAGKHHRHLLGNDESFIEVMEITMKNLLTEGKIDYRDFLCRADILQSLGKTVLVSNFAEFHRLGAYLNLYTTRPIGITLGVPLLEEIFEEKWYENLEGGILESFGRLFKNQIKLYAYPTIDRESGNLKTAEDVVVRRHLQYLYRYLLENRFVHAVETSVPEALNYSSSDVARMIGDGDEKWKELVPEGVPEELLCQVR